MVGSFFPARRLAVPGLLSLLVLAGCTTKTTTPGTKTTAAKPVDIETLAQRKIPDGVKDRAGLAKDLLTTLKSQNLEQSEENICSVLAVALQESNLPGRSGCAGVK